MLAMEVMIPTFHYNITEPIIYSGNFLDPKFIFFLLPMDKYMDVCLIIAKDLPFFVINHDKSHIEFVYFICVD